MGKGLFSTVQTPIRNGHYGVGIAIEPLQEQCCISCGVSFILVESDLKMYLIYGTRIDTETTTNPWSSLHFVLHFIILIPFVRTMTLAK